MWKILQCSAVVRKYLYSGADGTGGGDNGKMSHESNLNYFKTRKTDLAMISTVSSRLDDGWGFELVLKRRSADAWILPGTGPHLAQQRGTSHAASMWVISRGKPFDSSPFLTSKKWVHQTNAASRQILSGTSGLDAMQRVLVVE